MENRRNETGLQIVSILKYIVLLMVVAFVVWMFQSKNSRDVAFAALCDEMESSGFMDKMKTQDEAEARTYLGISKNDYTDFYFAASSNRKKPQELLIVKTESDRDSDRIVKKLQTHIEKQKEIYSEGKSLSDASILLQRAVIKKQGAYVFYAVSPEVESLKHKFLKSI